MDEAQKQELLAEKKQQEERYFLARNRALERSIRAIEMNREVLSAFRDGLHVAEGIMDPAECLAKCLPETNYGFAFMCGVLSRLEALKGQHYGASWMKRGEIGIHANVARKFDRLEELMQGVGEEGETVGVNCGDMAVYALKWMTFRAEFQPAEILSIIQECIKLKPKLDTESKGEAPFTESLGDA